MGRIDALLVKTRQALDGPGLQADELRDYVVEGVLARTRLDLAVHLERLAVITALGIDGHVPPRSRDGARALFDLVTRPTRLRPALLRDHADLRAILRERHGRRLAGGRVADRRPPVPPGGRDDGGGRGCAGGACSRLRTTMRSSST